MAASEKPTPQIASMNGDTRPARNRTSPRPPSPGGWSRPGGKGDAEAVVAGMIRENFSLEVASVAINADWSSLNSLNGIVETGEGRRFFFKFHQEEGEEATVEEYYRAELLQRAGLPVDLPVLICRRPGHQILLYAFRRDRQLAAACLEMERSGDDSAAGRLLAMQAELDRLTGSDLRRDAPCRDGGGGRGRAGAPALPQPPRRRRAPGRLGGRFARFYGGQAVALPDDEIGWEDFAALRWRINGIDYRPHARRAVRGKLHPARPSPPRRRRRHRPRRRP